MAGSKKKSASTRRVQVGYETFMNTETGELVEMPKFVIQGGDVNFEKVWVWHLCDAYELVGNKAVLVLNYLFENRNDDNMVIASQRKIADSSKVSLTTVAKIITKLKNNDILSMPQQGVYRINPEVMWKGSHNARMQVLYEYKNEKKSEEPRTRNQKMQSLKNRSDLLMREVAKIQREMQDLIASEIEEAAAE